MSKEVIFGGRKKYQDIQLVFRGAQKIAVTSEHTNRAFLSAHYYSSLGLPIFCTREYNFAHVHERWASHREKAGKSHNDNSVFRWINALHPIIKMMMLVTNYLIHVTLSLCERYVQVIFYIFQRVGVNSHGILKIPFFSAKPRNCSYAPEYDHSFQVWR